MLNKLVSGEIELFLGRFRPKFLSETSEILLKKAHFVGFGGKNCVCEEFGSVIISS